MAPLQTLVRWLGSYWLAAVLFVLILLLVLASTFEQGRSTLYDVIDRYYESAIVVHYWGGRYPTPLPGGALLFPLLFVNLLVGGIVRMRVRWANVGILIVHLGMIGLFVGGYAEAQTATRGAVKLWEPRLREDRLHVDDVYVNREEWEVVVFRADGDGGGSEFVVPQSVFEDARGGSRVRATSGDLPFDLVLEGYLRNARIERLPPERRDEGAEGHRLVEKEAVKAEEAQRTVNLPGLYATLQVKATGETIRALLSGLRRRPFALRLGEQKWTVDVRQRSWHLPFQIALDRFVHEFHPGTGMPRRFSSYVRVRETRDAAPVDREVHITMNEPLRYGDYTVYQSGWGPEDPRERRPDGRMHSVLAVVYNPTDHLPLGLAWSTWACFVITIGLVLHYVLKLIRYTEDERRTTPVPNGSVS